MFQRRVPQTKLQHVRELIWPSMGWRRALRYTWLRVTRLSDSTHSIALGLAVGVAISFNPILGTHFIQAGILAWLLRANILCAFIGTFMGNPWTFPFLWWAGLETGAYVFRDLGMPENLPQHLDFSILWNLVTHEPMSVLLPWTIGAYVLGALSMLIIYPLGFWLVRAAKDARRAARLHKIHQLALEVTSGHGDGP